MTTPAEKGLALEIAVQTIETVVLAWSPAMHGQPFKIERRKTITVDGVRHEIDVFAKVGAAKGYESIFIFECKNWEDPVGKNEIIVFSAKIDAAVAHRGFFVAKEFTKDARAQAARNPRITMLYASEHDPTNVPPPHGFHLTAPAGAKPSIMFLAFGASGAHADPIHVPGKLVRLQGTDVLLSEFLDAWIEEVYQQRLLRFWTVDLPEGVHPMLEEDERSFIAGEFVIDGRDIEYARIHVEYGVEIIRPAVISDFEVATRGRVIRLATAKVRDVAIDTSYVTTFTD